MSSVERHSTNRSSGASILSRISRILLAIRVLRRRHPAKTSIIGTMFCRRHSGTLVDAPLSAKFGQHILLQNSSKKESSNRPNGIANAVLFYFERLLREM